MSEQSHTLDDISEMESYVRETYTMSREEIDRCQIIRGVIAKSIGVESAAELLKISPRQVYRLKRQYEAEGEHGVIHHAKKSIQLHLAIHAKMSGELRDKEFRVFGRPWRRR